MIGLNDALENVVVVKNYLYSQGDNWYADLLDEAADALALLKEQEPVKPEFDSLDGNVGRWRCGSCHISLGAVRPPYCWHCGKAVKWG